MRSKVELQDLGLQWGHGWVFPLCCLVPLVSAPIALAFGLFPGWEYSLLLAVCPTLFWVLALFRASHSARLGLSGRMDLSRDVCHRDGAALAGLYLCLKPGDDRRPALYHADERARPLPAASSWSDLPGGRTERHPHILGIVARPEPESTSGCGRALETGICCGKEGGRSDATRNSASSDRDPRGHGTASAREDSLGHRAPLPGHGDGQTPQRARP